MVAAVLGTEPAQQAQILDGGGLQREPDGENAGAPRRAQAPHLGGPGGWRFGHGHAGDVTGTTLIFLGDDRGMSRSAGITASIALNKILVASDRAEVALAIVKEQGLLQFLEAVAADNADLRHAAARLRGERHGGRRAIDDETRLAKARRMIGEGRGRWTACRIAAWGLPGELSIAKRLHRKLLKKGPRR